MKATEGEVVERQMEVADPRALEALNRSEIDVQIATAKRFPRSVVKFNAEATSLVSLSEAVAEECIYALERDQKTIEGPSARFAEIVAYSWGNCRAGARVIDEAGEFVTAQGVFWDLEKNTAIGYEVKRRIVNKAGRRFSTDMIGVTANAACSIALRNAVLKGVPKALWTGVYETARQTIMGDFQTLGSRREAALASFAKFGVTPDRIYAKLGVAGAEDVSLEHMVTLRGILTAIKEGDSTVEEQFPVGRQEAGAGAALKSVLGAGARAEPSGTAQAQPSGSAEAKPGGEVQAAQAKVDAVVVDEGDAALGRLAEKKPPEQEQAAPKGPLPKGTPRVRKQFIESMAAAKERNELGGIYADVPLYEWAAADRDALKRAFEERAAQIKG